MEASTKGKHTVFVDSKKDAVTFDAAKFFDTVPELVHRQFNRVKRSTLATATVVGPTDRKTIKKLRKKRDAAYAELEAREERAHKMRKAAKHFEAQRNLLSKGRRVKVKDADGDDVAVFKWKPQRKR